MFLPADPVQGGGGSCRALPSRAGGRGPDAAEGSLHIVEGQPLEGRVEASQSRKVMLLSRGARAVVVPRHAAEAPTGEYPPVVSLQ